jgi:polyhydroxyalkanoate synthase subunit PhaC
MSASATDAVRLAREVEEFQRRMATSAATLARLPPVTLATAPRELVYRDGKVTLYRYRRGAGATRRPPLLIVFSLVNRPSVLDLQPDRSLIRALLAAGLDVYLLDWGYPDRGDRHTTLADYTTGYLKRAVEHVGTDGPIDLLGVCQGGTLALLYASLEPERIRRLVTMVAPVDFHTPDNLLSKWVRGVDIDRLVDTFGNVPGELLNTVFVSLMPFRLTVQKYLALIDGADDARQLENFLRMEQWIYDSPDQAGAAFREFVKSYFQENRLMRGSATLGGQAIDLGRVTMPVLNVYATEDHLVPAAAARALAGLVGSRDYRELAFDGGHIGIYVSSRAAAIPAGIAEWLATPDRAAPRRGARKPR